jgi:multiple sugar transport system permease protein
LGCAFLFPLFWMLSTSLKSPPQVFTFPPVWLPAPLEPSNYLSAMNYAPFGTYFANTFLYCGTTVLGVTASSSIVAYGFSRLRWRGRNVLFFIVISTMMLPFLVTMIPLFVLFKHLGLTGTLWPLIIPTFFGSSAFSIFLLRQFFLTLPEALCEAARVDGASELWILARVIVPLSKPALATVALFQFIYAWNDFLGPLIYVNNQSQFTVAIGLQEFLTMHNSQWAWLMAASTVVTVPIIVLFFLTQKTFIQGITFTGIKE